MICAQGLDPPARALVSTRGKCSLLRTVSWSSGVRPHFFFRLKWDVVLYRKLWILDDFLRHFLRRWCALYHPFPTEMRQSTADRYSATAGMPFTDKRWAPRPRSGQWAFLPFSCVYRLATAITLILRVDVVPAKDVMRAEFMAKVSDSRKSHAKRRPRLGDGGRQHRRHERTLS